MNPMNFELPDDLPDWAYESCRINKTHKKWAMYLQLNQKHLRKTYDLRLHYSDNKLCVPLRELKSKNRRFKVGPKLIPAWDIFYESMPFFKVDTLGNGITGKLTEVIIPDKKLVQKLFKEIEPENPLDLYYWLTDTDISKMPTIPINPKSLSNLIQTNINNLGDPNISDIQRAKLKNQNNYAQRMMEYLDACEKQGVPKDMLPYVEKEHIFGRTYHTGINLISCPRNVRHAALGDCYEYDLENAILSYKLSFLEQLLDSNEYKKLFSYEYLTEKKRIRIVLTKTVSNAFKNQGMKSFKSTNEEMVKHALTSLMFGAPPTSKSWLMPDGERKYSALPSCIKNPMALDAFINADIHGVGKRPFVKLFAEEQKLLDDIILSEPVVIEMLNKQITKHPELVAKLKYKKGSWKKSTCMVFLYQQAEKNIMEFVKKETDCLLHVHDAIYTRKPINFHKLNEAIKDKFGEFFKLSETHIKATQIGGYNAELERHKQHLKQEQADAEAAVRRTGQSLAAVINGGNITGLKV